MRMRFRRQIFRLSCWAVWVALLLLAGCYAGSSENQPNDASRAMTVVQDWTTQPTHRGDAPPRLSVLESVNVSDTSGVDRIVFGFRNADLPAYEVRYPGEPIRQCGSGRPLKLAGATALEVQFENTRAHTEGGASTLLAREMVVNQPVIKEVAVACDFEGRVVWGIGVSTRSPYRALEDSTAGRVAIDLRR